MAVPSPKIMPRSSDLDHLAWLKKVGLGQMGGKSVLDLGCGSGYLLKAAIEQGAIAGVGLDLIPPDGALGSLHFLTADLNGGDWLSKADVPQKNFDLILAFDILEHLESPYRFLQHARALLNPKDGRMVVTTPNVNSWERVMKPFDWSGQRDPEHKTLFTTYALQFLLRRLGFKVEHIEAPVRKLGPLENFFGPIGGQIFCVFSKV